LVPNAALRWPPKPEQIAPEFRASSNQPSSEESQTGSYNHNHQGVVWIQEGSYVRPIKVRTGLNDGTMTEITGDGIKEGLQIITGELQQTETNTGTTNPFVPQIRKSRN
jgi:HlyD family secretion protein